MTNCLSSSKFANLLFVNVQIGDVGATALFDTGAGMTVIAQSLLHRLRAAPEKKSSAPETIAAWFVGFRLPSFPISGWEMFAWKTARCS